MLKTINSDNEKMLLIAIPFAGGSSQNYFSLGKAVDKLVELKSIDYAGHGLRFSKPVSQNFDELLEDYYQQLEKIINNRDFILFGHSMGALAAAYLAEQLYVRYGTQMKGLVLSSCIHPKAFSETNHGFSTDDELIDYLCADRNVPRDIANSSEFMQYIYPVIKNDFLILSNFIYKPLRLPNCKTFAIWGDLDYGIDQHSMADWQLHTNNVIKWFSVSGTHFYFEENLTDTIIVINEIVEQCKREDNDDCK